MSNEIYDRDSFFLMILSEYRDYKEIFQNSEAKLPSCFIYDYIKQKKHSEILSVSQSLTSIKTYAENKKKNKYTLLKAMQKAHENQIIGKEYFTKLFIELTGEANFKENDVELIKKYEHKFLFSNIDDFFYNKGYSVSQGAKREKSKKQPDGYIDDLDMLCQYYKFSREKGKGTSLSSSSSVITEKYIQECDELLSIMIEEENDEIFVPLYFDSKHGAGVFIVGTSYCPESENVDNCCAVSVSCFSGVLSTELDPDLEIGLNSVYFNNVADAFDYFQKNTYKFYEDYTISNNISKPEHVNDDFKPFFDFDVNRKRKKRKEQERKEIAKNYVAYKEKNLI